MIGATIENFNVMVDADKMETVMTNLVENAIKYSPRHSTVVLSLTQDGDNFILKLSNPTQTEIVAPSLLVQEFKKSSELSSGIGMGLWICDQIVQLHGFTLVLESEGREFTATLIIKI